MDQYPSQKEVSSSELEGEGRMTATCLGAYWSFGWLLSKVFLASLEIHTGPREMEDTTLGPGV